jgi:hypothetical protein
MPVGYEFIRDKPGTKNTSTHWWLALDWCSQEVMGLDWGILETAVAKKKIGRLNGV